MEKENNSYKFVNLRGAITAGIFGAIAFVLAFGLGSVINAATGIPLTGGITNGVIVGAVVTLALIRAEKQFGAATLLWTVFTLLAVGTATFGPPGWYKIIVGLLSGLIWDICLWILANRKWKYEIAAGFGAVAITVLVFAGVSIIGLPAAETLRKALVFLIPMNFVISFLGAWFGEWLHRRYFDTNAEG